MSVARDRRSTALAIRRRDDIFTSDLDDTLLMLSLEQGRYFSLEGEGPRIWALLERPTTEEEIVQRLIREVEVAPDICAAEVSSFLAALREHRLLVEVD